MLTSSQLARLTDCTIQMHRARDLDDLGRLTADTLRVLVPSDFVLITLAATHFPPVRFSYASHAADWNRYASDFLHHAHEDPVYTNRLRLLLDRAACATQFQSAKELERTALHEEIWQPRSIRRFLRYLTPGRLGYRLEIARTTDIAFTEDETEILNAIGRHLDAATEALIARHAGRLPAGGQLHPVQFLSWLVCDDQGRILRSTDQARTLMSACLGESALTTALPKEWLDELHRRRAGHAPRPSWYHASATPISVHVAPIRPTQSEFSVVFLERPAPPDPTAALMRSGLTRREAEVLRWLAEGKSNAEIGIILGISGLTAKKHLESVFHKLGVENRTAAVVIALETMRDAG